MTYSNNFSVKYIQTKSRDKVQESKHGRKSVPPRGWKMMDSLCLECKDLKL